MFHTYIFGKNSIRYQQAGVNCFKSPHSRHAESSHDLHLSRLSLELFSDMDGLYPRHDWTGYMQPLIDPIETCRFCVTNILGTRKCTLVIGDGRWTMGCTPQFLVVLFGQKWMIYSWMFDFKKWTATKISTQTKTCTDRLAQTGSPRLVAISEAGVSPTARLQWTKTLGFLASGFCMDSHKNFYAAWNKSIP